MRSVRWKRIGQSDQELGAAILFSFVIHGLFIVAFLLASLLSFSKISVPISYQVMLVTAPTTVEPAAQPQEAAAPSPKPAEPPAQKKTVPKTIAAAPKAQPPAITKSAMPDLGAQKTAQKKIEQQPEANAVKEKPATPSTAASPVAGAGKKEAVTVNPVQQNQLPGLSDYFPLVTQKIERYWNPPQGIRGVRAKVMFKILRSGRVVDVKLKDLSGNFYFDQAANRAILSVGSFPQLPDEYPREYLELSVDLEPKQ